MEKPASGRYLLGEASTGVDISIGRVFSICGRNWFSQQVMRGAASAKNQPERNANSIIEGNGYTYTLSNIPNRFSLFSNASITASTASYHQVGPSIVSSSGSHLHITSYPTSYHRTSTLSYRSQPTLHCHRTISAQGTNLVSLAFVAYTDALGTYYFRN